ncbi:hypothetical protein D1BOALGB6SA_2110 [Olavius sp. associated proteobacterium Delta 1]|nr:hypothetical protein D1BOALGB6SA_2110 [Olavius sp. associated proteobacterium Delta 1]
MKSSKHPVDVAEYKITKRLPKKYQSDLPTPKELREQLQKAVRNFGDVTSRNFGDVLYIFSA